jgi:hypothetical protein
MKTIVISNGSTVLVDDKDFEALSQYKWTAHVNRTTCYAIRRQRISEDRPGSIVYMHRQIMCPMEGMVVDHINKDGLDNRRENLRICSQTENLRNQRPRSNKRSKFKGVSWNENDMAYHSRLQFGGRGVWLGMYKSEVDAAKAYDAGAIHYYGKYALTNVQLGLLKEAEQ